MPPRKVVRPVATTTAVAVPLSTLVPRKQTLVSSRGDRARRAVFSCGEFLDGERLPGQAALDEEQVLHESSRTSAGIMSPAASFTTSPGTRWATGSS